MPGLPEIFLEEGQSAWYRCCDDCEVDFGRRPEGKRRDVPGQVFGVEDFVKAGDLEARGDADDETKGEEAGALEALAPGERQV